MSYDCLPWTPLEERLSTWCARMPANDPTENDPSGAGDSAAAQNMAATGNVSGDSSIHDTDGDGDYDINDFVNDVVDLAQDVLGGALAGNAAAGAAAGGVGLLIGGLIRAGITIYNEGGAPLSSTPGDVSSFEPGTYSIPGPDGKMVQLTVAERPDGITDGLFQTSTGAVINQRIFSDGNVYTSDVSANNKPNEAYGGRYVWRNGAWYRKSPKDPDQPGSGAGGGGYHYQEISPAQAAQLDLNPAGPATLSTAQGNQLDRALTAIQNTGLVTIGPNGFAHYAQDGVPPEDIQDAIDAYNASKYSPNARNEVDAAVQLEVISGSHTQNRPVPTPAPDKPIKPLAGLMQLVEKQYPEIDFGPDGAQWIGDGSPPVQVQAAIEAFNDRPNQQTITDLFSNLIFSDPDAPSLGEIDPFPANLWDPNRPSEAPFTDPNAPDPGMLVVPPYAGLDQLYKEWFPGTEVPHPDELPTAHEEWVALQHELFTQTMLAGTIQNYIDDIKEQLSEGELSLPPEELQDLIERLNALEGHHDIVLDRIEGVQTQVEQFEQQNPNIQNYGYSPISETYVDPYAAAQNILEAHGLTSEEANHLIQTIQQTPAGNPNPSVEDVIDDINVILEGLGSEAPINQIELGPEDLSFYGSGTHNVQAPIPNPLAKVPPQLQEHVEQLNKVLSSYQHNVDLLHVYQQIIDNPLVPDHLRDQARLGLQTLPATIQAQEGYIDYLQQRYETIEEGLDPLGKPFDWELPPGFDPVLLPVGLDPARLAAKAEGDPRRERDLAQMILAAFRGAEHPVLKPHQLKKLRELKAKEQTGVRLSAAEARLLKRLQNLREGGAAFRDVAQRLAGVGLTTRQKAEMQRLRQRMLAGAPGGKAYREAQFARLLQIHRSAQRKRDALQILSGRGLFQAQKDELARLRGLKGQIGGGAFRERRMARLLRIHRAAVRLRDDAQIRKGTGLAEKQRARLRALLAVENPSPYQLAQIARLQRIREETVANRDQQAIAAGRGLTKQQRQRLRDLLAIKDPSKYQLGQIERLQGIREGAVETRDQQAIAAGAGLNDRQKARLQKLLAIRKPNKYQQKQIDRLQGIHWGAAQARDNAQVARREGLTDDQRAELRRIRERNRDGAPGGQAYRDRQEKRLLRLHRANVRRQTEAQIASGTGLRDKQKQRLKDLKALDRDPNKKGGQAYRRRERQRLLRIHRETIRQRDVKQIQGGKGLTAAQKNRVKALRANTKKGGQAYRDREIERIIGIRQETSARRTRKQIREQTGLKAKQRDRLKALKFKGATTVGGKAYRAKEFRRLKDIQVAASKDITKRQRDRLKTLREAGRTSNAEYRKLRHLKRRTAKKKEVIQIAEGRGLGGKQKARLKQLQTLNRDPNKKGGKKYREREEARLKRIHWGAAKTRDDEQIARGEGLNKGQRKELARVRKLNRDPDKKGGAKYRAKQERRLMRIENKKRGRKADDMRRFENAIYSYDEHKRLTRLKKKNQAGRLSAAEKRELKKLHGKHPKAQERATERAVRKPRQADRLKELRKLNRTSKKGGKAFREKEIERLEKELRRERRPEPKPTRKARAINKRQEADLADLRRKVRDKTKRLSGAERRKLERLKAAEQRKPERRKPSRAELRTARRAEQDVRRRRTEREVEEPGRDKRRRATAEDRRAERQGRARRTDRDAQRRRDARQAREEAEALKKAREVRLAREAAEEARKTRRTRDRRRDDDERRDTRRRPKKLSRAELRKMQRQQDEERRRKKTRKPEDDERRPKKLSRKERRRQEEERRREKSRKPSRKDRRRQDDEEKRKKTRKPKDDKRKPKKGGLNKAQKKTLARLQKIVRDKGRKLTAAQRKLYNKLKSSA